jgi:hypothetical protein
MTAASIDGVAAVINESLGHSLSQVCQPPEVLVVAVLLTGKEGVQGVVKVLVPVGVDTVSPQFGGARDTGIVEIILGNEHQAPTEVGLQVLYLSGELL